MKTTRSDIMIITHGDYSCQFTLPNEDKENELKN